MSKKQVFKRWVLFLFSAIGMILAFGTSMGQVRFDDPVNLSNSRPNNSYNPNIAAVDDQVFVFWRNPSLQKSDIFLAHSKDNGVQFRIRNLTGDSEIEDSYPPHVVADGDYIYVGWAGAVDRSDLRTAAPFFSRSTDGGKSFEPPYDISGRGAFGEPIMRIQDGILNVAWTGYDQESRYQDVLFAKSTDLGKSFTEPVMVSDISLRSWGIGSSPALALDGDQVYVGWMGGRPDISFYDIHFARSTDGGKTFGETIILSEKRTQEGELATGPQLSVGSKGYIYAAWTQGKTPFPISDMDIYFSRSIDGGETFSKPLNLSNNPRAVNAGTRMVAAGDNVYVVWQGITAAVDIFFSRSTDGGENFSEPQNLSNNPCSSVAPQIAVIEKGKLLDEGISEDVIYLVWQGCGPAIFFSVSVDGGETFSEPENISNSPSFSNWARMAAVGKNVYVTWMDNPNGNWDALFVRGRLELNNSKSRRFRE